jgi:hypothetical protein
VRFLSHVHVLVAFLADIYGIHVDDKVKAYLRDCLKLKQLVRCHNTSDQAEFWRRIRALQTEYVSIDATRCCNGANFCSKDLTATLSTGTIDFANHEFDGEFVGTVNHFFKFLELSYAFLQFFFRVKK